jgi:hypothetical protein
LWYCLARDADKALFATEQSGGNQSRIVGWVKQTSWSGFKERYPLTR